MTHVSEVEVRDRCSPVWDLVDPWEPLHRASSAGRGHESRLIDSPFSYNILPIRQHFSESGCARA
jgi:hypothetical protein